MQGSCHIHPLPVLILNASMPGNFLARLTVAGPCLTARAFPGFPGVHKHLETGQFGFAGEATRCNVSKTRGAWAVPSEPTGTMAAPSVCLAVLDCPDSRATIRLRACSGWRYRTGPSLMYRATISSSVPATMFYSLSSVRMVPVWTCSLSTQSGSSLLARGAPAPLYTGVRP